jgi:eukaryotic-like serine/threonine-protein kinase
VSADSQPSRGWLALSNSWRRVLSWTKGISLSSSIHLDEEALRRLLQTEESEGTEFKQRLLSYKELAEYAVGIGNAGGGLLLMGVSDKRPRKLIGIPESSLDDLKKIQLSIHNSAAIRVSPQLVKTQNGLYVLGIQIPARPRGQVFCTQEGKYLIRVGESLVGIPPTEIARIQAERRPVRKTLVVWLILLLVVGFVANRLFRRGGQPMISPDSVVVGDIENLTGENTLDEMTKQAVAAKLSESPFLTVLSEKRIRDALQEMRLPVDQKLTQQVTDEVCVREGLKAGLTGSIATVGGHYVIGLRAADCKTGDLLALEQMEADDREHLIAMVGKAVSDLRRKLGESFQSGQKFDIPLERATTRSSEAWRFFTLGNKDLMTNDNEGAIRFFELAIQKDPDFALAYAKIAQAYDNLDENGNAVRYAEEAFKRRENVTEHERFYIIARYYDIVTGEVEKEIETLTDWKQAYPKDWMPRYDLADEYSSSFGRCDAAAEEAREAIRLNPKDPDVYSSLAGALIGKGTFQDAAKTIDIASAQGLDSSALRIARFEIGLLQGDDTPTLRTPSWPTEESDEDAVSQQEAWLAVRSGKMAVAHKEIHAVAERMANRGLKESAGAVESDMAVAEAEYGDLGKAHEDMNSALAFARKPNVLVNAALVFSLTGEDKQANDVMEELHRRFPKDTLINAVWIPVARATQEIANGQPKRGLELLESSRPYELGEQAEYSPIYRRGLAYLKMRDWGDAANEFQKIIDHRGVSPTSELPPLAYLGIARALEMSGDHTRSRNSYEVFLNLWKDADANTPVLREARAEYLKLM